MHHLVTYWRGLRRSTRRTLLSFGVGALLIGGLYTSYCWGGLGRNVLPLQYLLQCRCPPASEAVRYPHLNILASACDNPRVHTMSPSGHRMVVEHQKPSPHIEQIDIVHQQTYPLRLNTLNISGIYYLNEQLLLGRHPYEAGYFLYNSLEHAQITLPFTKTFSIEGSVFELIQEAEQIIVLDVETVVLGPHYDLTPDRSIVLYTIDSQLQTLVNEQLSDLGIAYEEVQPPYQAGPIYGARYAPDGRFYALHDGIYDATTRERLRDTNLPIFDAVEGYRAVGWVAGQRGIVYAAGTPYLFDSRDDLLFPYTWFPVHQPVLLLELPEEFWTELEEEP